MQVNSEQIPTPEHTRADDAPETPRRGGASAVAHSAAVSESDAAKAAALRRMKSMALALLLGMAVVFTVAFALQKQYPWLDYVTAAAEGRIAGALADWFAVTALLP